MDLQLMASCLEQDPGHGFFCDFWITEPAKQDLENA